MTGPKRLVPKDATFEDENLEQFRDAKGHLKKIIPEYSETLDQAVLANGIDLGMVRVRSRSFRRFCSAIQQIAEGIRNNQHTVTPEIPEAADL